MKNSHLEVMTTSPAGELIRGGPARKPTRAELPDIPWRQCMRRHSRFGIYAMTWVLILSSGRLHAQAAADWSATDRALGRAGADQPGASTIQLSAQRSSRRDRGRHAQAGARARIVGRVQANRGRPIDGDGRSRAHDRRSRAGDDEAPTGRRRAERAAQSSGRRNAARDVHAHHGEGRRREDRADDSRRARRDAHTDASAGGLAARRRRASTRRRSRARSATRERATAASTRSASPRPEAIRKRDQTKFRRRWESRPRSTSSRRRADAP